MTLSARARSLAFLAASFLSSVGDTLLLFAVPAGLSLETNDLRSAVLMWLIPAVAVFVSSFLQGHVEKRIRTARADYGKLLITVAVIEIAIAFVALKVRSHAASVVLIACFVFLYAFVKEGVPRLLYVVSIYRYFIKPQDYTKIAAADQAGGIAAGVVGTTLAALLIHFGTWRLALILDAITFIVFGLAIMKVGIDPESNTTESAPPIIGSIRAFGAFGNVYQIILLSVSTLAAIDALVWNYVPIFCRKFSIVDPSLSIFLIGVLRLPGALAGLSIERMSKVFSLEGMVGFIPLANIACSVAFIVFPSFTMLSMLIVIQGVIQGLYWPADYTIRNRLGHSALVAFNAISVRRLCIFQFLACCAAIAIDTLQLDMKVWVPGAIVAFTALALLGLPKFREAMKFQAATLVLLAMGLSGCSSRSARRTIVFPSISRNLELRNDLTYAAFAILNDTSAHLVTMSSDLTLNPEVLRKFDQLGSGSTYRIQFNPDYRSVQGEGFEAKDFLFTVQYFLREKPDLAGPYRQIVGSEACKRAECDIRGLHIENPQSVLIELKKPDFRYLEKLSSPWLVMLKAGRPAVERVGQCSLPYQTGRAKVEACDAAGVTLKYTTGQTILVSEESGSKESGERYRIVNDNPGLPPSPTLTILAAFANPQSSNLKSRQRQAMFDTFRKNSRSLAESLKLRWSPLMTAQWLAVPVPDDLAEIARARTASCPKRPVQVLLDTSLPDLGKMRGFLTRSIGCPVSFSVTTADKYFQDFAKSDLGVAWFTPDFLDLYNEFSAFDCAGGGNCYFNWKDKGLQAAISGLRASCEANHPDKAEAIEIERRIAKQGYAAPLAEMNWWILGPHGYRPIHTAGLAQVRVSDFL